MALIRQTLLSRPAAPATTTPPAPPLAALSFADDPHGLAAGRRHPSVIPWLIQTIVGLPYKLALK
jgi:hypothetical protein